MKYILFNLFKKIVKPLQGLGLRYRFPFVDRAYRFILSRIRPEYTEINGIKIFLDSKDSMEFSVRSFEPGVTRLFKERMIPRGIFVDIGAHIGYYTLFASKLVGPDGFVFAFEPNPDNCALLEKSIKTNGFTNIELVKKAAARSTGKTSLFMSGVSNDNRCYDVGEKRKRIEVETISLDDFFKGVQQKINFIKIDVDGFEFNVLRGAEKLISNSENLMLITEFCPSYLVQAGEDPQEYFLYLKKLGFDLFLIDDKKGELKKTDVGELLAGASNFSHNLFCIKGAN